MLMFGLARSILSRSTCAPSGNSPAFIRRKQVEILRDAAAAVRARLPGLRQRAAKRAHLGRRRALHVGQVMLDEPLGKGIKLVVVVRCVIAMNPPIEAEPAHGIGDRRLELDVLLGGIGVVETEVAAPAVLGGEAEIQDDRLGVPIMQIAVGLWRKAGDNFPAVFAGSIVLGDDGAEEVGRRGRRSAGSRIRAGATGAVGGLRVGSTFLAAAQHSSSFVHEQQNGLVILTGRTAPVIGRVPSTDCRVPRNPRQIRLSAGLPPPPKRGCPQILWIIVCVSCKYGG